MIQIKKWPLQAKKSVLFFENFPIENAGYQYRAKKWADIFNENDFNAVVWTTIKSKQKFEKLLASDMFWFFVRGLFVRTFQVVFSLKFETVIVRRELLHYNDYGNLFLDKLLLTIHPNVILDFDDDIAAAKNQPKIITSIYGKIMLENGNKFKDSLRLYERFVVGSNYLKECVQIENSTLLENSILVIPTCVDYDNFPRKDYSLISNKAIAFGWIGSNDNLQLLEKIVPDLNKLSKLYPIKLIVISGKKFNPQVDFPIENLTWSYEREKESLMKIDIGLMPLNNTEVAKGKCGFKLIQYMGMGIVSVASGITANKEIIKNELCSYIVSPEKGDWYDTFVKAIDNKGEFETIGKRAYQRIAENYSFKANMGNYFLFLQI